MPKPQSVFRIGQLVEHRFFPWMLTVALTAAYAAVVWIVSR